MLYLVWKATVVDVVVSGLLVKGKKENKWCLCSFRRRPLRSEAHHEFSLLRLISVVRVWSVQGAGKYP